MSDLPMFADKNKIPVEECLQIIFLLLNKLGRDVVVNTIDLYNLAHLELVTERDIRHGSGTGEIHLSLVRK